MRIVVAGVGRWGRIHCEKVLMAEWSTLVGVLDLDETRARKAGGDFSTAFSTSWDHQMQADFVILAAPWERVAELVEHVCGRGLSFLAEKPVTVSLNESQHLASLQKSAGVLGAVGYQMRFHPRIPKLIGTQRVTVIREEPAFEDLWQLVCDCGVHDIDLALFILGPLASVTDVKLTSRRLEVEAVSVSGGTVKWSWRLGPILTRMIMGDDASIDLLEPCEALVARQWDAVGETLKGGTSNLAGLDDVGAVAKVLQSIKVQVQVA